MVSLVVGPKIELTRNHVLANTVDLVEDGVATLRQVLFLFRKPIDELEKVTSTLRRVAGET